MKERLSSLSIGETSVTFANIKMEEILAQKDLQIFTSPEIPSVEQQAETSLVAPLEGFSKNLW